MPVKKYVVALGQEERLMLLRQRVIELCLVDAISHDTVRRTRCAQA